MIALESLRQEFDSGKEISARKTSKTHFRKEVFVKPHFGPLNKPSKSSFFSPNWLSMASLAQTGVTILDMTISKAFGTVPERILTNVNVNKPTNAVLTEIITEKATFKPFFRANFNDNLQSNSLNKFCNRKIDT